MARARRGKPRSTDAAGINFVSKAHLWKLRGNDSRNIAQSEVVSGVFA